MTPLPLRSWATVLRHPLLMGLVALIWYNFDIGGLKQLKDRRLVGMDCLELAPHYDPTGVSAITMAKTLREMIILASLRKR